MDTKKKTPVIIDFDPGLDDAVCMMMMLGCGKFDVLGLCPVNVNKPLSVTEANALKLAELCNRPDIPVLRGAKKAIFKEQRTSGDVHGANGLGNNVVLPDPVKKVEKEYAWDFTYRMAKEYPGELEILAVGPLTNLGIALMKYPDLPKYVKRIVIMGGAFSRGNWTPAAEFNIYADPDAAKMVFNCGIPTAMMGLEICMKAYLTKDDLARLEQGGRVSKVAADLIRDRVNGWPGMSEEQKKKHKGAVVCDAVASCYMINPDVIEADYVAIDVETKGLLTEGKTTAVRPFTETQEYKPNCYAGMDIDRAAFADIFVSTIANLD